MSTNQFGRYESPLTHRYSRGSKIIEIFSDQHKIETWRQLWIWLAEAEMELGLAQVTQEAIDEMKTNMRNIDFGLAAAEEKRLKHDVMAHNHTFGKICPKAAGIIHLGATSCFVQDNADLILQKEALQHVLQKIAICLQRLGDFAKKHAETVTVGRTHYQPASLVTVGKRAIIWAQELLSAFHEIESGLINMRFRGIKGATGTQDSFMTLFNEDEEKVEKLDALVTAKAGFTKKFFISGQTYSRQQDTKLIFGLSNLASAMKKIAHDIRFLQSHEEISEPFEADQIGSSAMPYKRNPMKCERIDSLCKTLMPNVEVALNVLSDQGLERTLDDSAARRMLIPDSFLTAEVALTVLQNVFEGLTVHHEKINRIVQRELPFLALEEALMRLSDHGVDRQEAHAKIREISLAARAKQDEGEKIHFEDLLKDTFFDAVRDQVIKTASDPINFAGRCASQVERFLVQELEPAIGRYLTSDVNKTVTLDV